METTALITPGVLLYLYLEIWTIRICLRYGGWAVAAALVVDHLLLLLTPWFAPGYLGWKVWFLWTAIRAEPLRGILWIPKLRLSEYRSSFRWPGWRVWLLWGLGPLVPLMATGWFPDATPVASLLALVVWFGGLAALLGRWGWSAYRRSTGPKKSFREPAPWTAGPYTW
jgi:hypothetical protein